MAAQNGFTPVVTVWVYYNHSSAVSTSEFENLSAEMFERCSGPDMIPLTVEVGTNLIELQEEIRKFFFACQW